MSTASLLTGQDEKTAFVRTLRRLFSFPVVLGCFLAVLAVLTVRGRFDDPDMWWHLKTGETIWTTHAIPTTDLFSFTAKNAAWIPHEWFAQLTIYAAYRLGGYSGLMGWLCVLSAGLLIAGYALCFFASGNAKIGFAGALVLWFFSTVGLSVRPQVMGYLLLVIELLLLHLGRKRSPRWFFGLPPLFALWVNCHGSFFLGLIVLGILLFCSYLEFQIGPLVSVRWDTGRRSMMAIASGLSVPVLFLNPDGAKQVFYPVNTMLRQPVNLSQISEWKPLLLSDPRGAGLAIILLLIVMILIIRRAEVIFIDEAVLLGISALLALDHQRMAIVFGIFAAPVVSRLLSRDWDNYDPTTDRTIPNTVCIGVAAVVCALAFPGPKALAQQVNEKSPAAAVEYIETHHLSGNMLNAYDYGGYLIWAMPEHPVFIDGRADLYEWAGVLSEFGRWATVQTDPNALLDKYDVKFCLLERDAPMAHVLPLMRNWKKVYSDESSVIFVRTSPGSSPSL